jgi:hypothetical protein
MKMTTLKWFLPVLFVLGMAVACDKDLNMDGADTTSLRVSVTPAPGTIPAAGTSFTAAVIVNQGQKFEVPWTVSVDNNPSWITVETTTLDRTFTGTYGGDDASYTVAGIKVTVSPNETGAKRMANLRFTVADNSSVIYTINQAQQ